MFSSLVQVSDQMLTSPASQWTPTKEGAVKEKKKTRKSRSIFDLPEMVDNDPILRCDKKQWNTDSRANHLI